MICPHCGVGIHLDWNDVVYPFPNEEEYYEQGCQILYHCCPVCKKIIVRLAIGDVDDDVEGLATCTEDTIIYPKFSIAKEISQYVPEAYRDLFNEASQVNSISPRASATLCRYLLQMVLHEELKIKNKNLEEEISQLEQQPNIPSSLIGMLQVMRRVANFGAHPKKSTHSNEILEIEQGEADVMLQLLEELFDYVFIKPRQQAEFLQSISGKFGIEM